MKELIYLILHCSATPKGRDIGVKTILKWHMGPKSAGHRGWSRAGYSDIITLDGQLHNLTSFDTDNSVDNKEMTWGVKGINAISRHICYIGGMNKFNTASEDTRTKRQKESLLTYVKYTILRHPNILVAGHNQFSAKACPSFNVGEWLEENCINYKNIYKYKAA